MLTNIVEINQETYMQVVKHNCRTGGNLMVLSQAGTGKTEMAQQGAAQEGFGVYYLNLSVLEAPDLMGLPIITEDGVVDYASPKFMPLEGKVPKPVVLLVDEIDKSKPELQNPLLELFQFHSINGRKMAIQAIIATGNLPDEGAHSQPVSHALTNRCKVYKMTHSFEPWCAWAKDQNVNPLVIGFLSKNQEYLSRPPIDGDPTAYARESPRSWTMAARDLDTTSSADSVEFQTLLVAGRVGSSAAAKFSVWLTHYRHIEPIVDKLVFDGTKPDTAGMTIDKQLVCGIAAVAKVSQACRAEKAKAADVNKVATNVFGWIKELPSEFQIAAVKGSLSMESIQQWQLTKIPAVMETYLKVRKAMKLHDSMNRPVPFLHKGGHREGHASKGETWMITVPQWSR